MTSPAQRKGDDAEREIMYRLRNLTGWHVERRSKKAPGADCGDLIGLPQCCVQVKSYRDLARGVREALGDLEMQRRNAQVPFAVALVRRYGGEWMAVMDVEMLCALLREATNA